MRVTEEEYLEHYGTPRRSGRYPWGSGGDDSGTPRNASLLDDAAKLRKTGMSEPEIAKALGLKTTTQLRALKSIARNEKKQADIARAQALREKGNGNVAIGKIMGINESSVRSLLDPGQKDRADILQTTASMLKDQVNEKGLIDIGTGVENHLGISPTRLSTSVAILQEQGYKVHYIKVQQLGTGQQTTMKVLSKPDVSYSEAFANRENIRQITEYSTDGGRSYLGLLPPLNIDSNRVKVRYAEEGGSEADGVMYLRPGVKDLSMGSARYAQVRVQVDGTHYLKGMAIYKDDLPPGVDIVFNTNKSSTGNKLDALKSLKEDKETGLVDADNPFGAVVRQIKETGPDGKVRVTSALNIVNEEGNWETWSRSLSSQTLSKQSPKLAKEQLAVTYARKKAALDEINGLTNPAVRKRLLKSYADDVDSSAVHLKAAALPRSSWHVLLPMQSVKETEIYAPNFRDGERVALIRYPHGGTFEIPELTVNNKHAPAKATIGRAKDAVIINSKVAQRLSGADFDGDAVLVIPNNKGEIKTSPALMGLKDFDPQSAYPAYPGMPKMSARTKGIQMGVVSNLITDMTIQGANTTDLAAAIRHSMVVIDAEKHNLNYKESARVNGIARLKAKYQGKPGDSIEARSRAGASTLISRANADIRVPDRKARSASKGGPIDPATGKKMFETTNEVYVNKSGKEVLRTIKSKKLAETDDAFTLSSGTPIEKVYAEHSNSLKALANTARQDYVAIRPTPYSQSAKAVYSTEVRSLDAKLNTALRNAPLERQAQVVANAIVSHKRLANPDMEAPDLKKIKAQALAEARNRTGAKKQHIDITDNEWAAIQAGAITNYKLTRILDNADLERIKQLATPKTPVLMSASNKSRAASLLARGYTQAEVADDLGVSLSTLKSGLE